MSRLGHLGANLYRGDVSYDFVGRRKVWYTISAVLLVISIGSLLFRGLTLGIEFKGGAEFQVKSPTVSTTAMQNTVSSIVGGEVVVQKIGTSTVRAQTEKLTEAELNQVRTELADRFNVSQDSIDTQFIGPSWGKDVSSAALRALIFFLLGVVVFLSLYFEWKMAVAAMIALLHDLIITAGIYSLVGFEVTPATVIGFLTILGYSLYDTVVVFDKVRENTRGLAGGSRMTYSQAANLAVNQTLVRSINTSIIALLPVAGLLIIGAGLLGAGSLEDLALALFIGLASGAYSSIFIATPIVVDLKEREPANQQLARRVAARKAKEGTPSAMATTAPRWGGEQQAATAAAAGATPVTAPVADSGEPGASRPTPAGPRPGSRPSGQQRRGGGRGGRPGGRGGRSKKRR